MDSEPAPHPNDLTGQVTTDDVANWEQRFQDARRDRALAERKVREVRRMARRHLQLEARCQSKRFVLKWWQRFRAAAENGPLQRGGTSLIIAATLSAVATILTGCVTLDPLPLVTAALFGLVLGGFVAATAVYFPTDSELILRDAELRERIDQESRRIADMTEQLRQAQNAADRVREMATHVEETYRRYQAALDSRRQRLLRTDWRALRGTAFEQFLEEVFEELGYDVQRTGRSGDQGADLIVAHEGRRTVIQAKAYTNSVGNDAVQQAFAGMRHHQCQACAVITNSRFTSSARDLAATTSCVLIDGDQLSRLITGQIRL